MSLDFNQVLLNLVEKKYEEIESKRRSGIFEKILRFEGNAIGQIGESFMKEVFELLGLPLDPCNKEIIHDEYDLLSKGKKVEIKTARKGLNNNNFQFNGINPKYNYDYIILLGITVESVHYYIIDKKQDYIYKHKERKEVIRIHNKEKQLVAMNPGNQANYKLTLTLNDLKPITSFEKDLRAFLIHDGLCV
ncbi:restriction endonuclease [Helicobacter mehlei]|uniref:Restriction endonuclease n=1 Tax=Helicobacter mehlei TaxID=2316080 RepID=A0A553UHZ1_9HELI|nr:restriction endonuclease [Helicobacter mehlei]TSA79827.1 restriction endonuclease [Helicobacter mehlei]